MYERILRSKTTKYARNFKSKYAGKEERKEVYRINVEV